MIVAFAVTGPQRQQWRIAIIDPTVRRIQWARIGAGRGSHRAGLAILVSTIRLFLADR
jgi:hypothetical protein